ncbi:MAG: DNA-formamidopyrimidine glycosylase family protein [Candidatus Thorarchaeota archaeon]
MPELPEIEAIRRYLILTISNQVITEVKTFRHTAIRNLPKTDFENLLNLGSLEDIERIGKILNFVIYKGNSILNLYLDHGLTGRLSWSTLKKLPGKTVFSIKFEQGKTLIYHDSRLHGAIWLFVNKSNKLNGVPTKIRSFGPDVLEISKEDFIKRLQRFNGEIKGILTNQKFVSGIGNAYADEILFEAKIHPFDKRPGLNDEEKIRLYHASKKILTESMNKIYHILCETQKLDNQSFWRQQIFRIHLKGKKPCPVCGNLISTIKAKRFTNFCRKCQNPRNRSFF